jgi:hypothetical protein
MLKKLQHMLILNTIQLLTDPPCDSGLALIVLVQNIFFFGGIGNLRAVRPTVMVKQWVV